MFGIRQTLAAAAAFFCWPETLTRPKCSRSARQPSRTEPCCRRRMAGDNKANPNCVGENVSPASGVDECASRYYELCAGHDRSGRPRRSGVDHWIAYGIPASVTVVCRGGDQQTVRQICRRHRHREAEHLHGPVHAARMRRITTPLL